MTNTLGVQDWLDVIGKEYLQGFVKDGGSSVKFAVPVSSDLGSLLKEAFAGMASNLGYVVARVDSSETRVHMPQEMFFKVAQQIDWRLLARRMILQLSAPPLGIYDISGIDPASEDPIAQSIGEANSVEESTVRLDMRRVLPNAVVHNRSMSRDFRLAMHHLCLTEVDSPRQSLGSSALIDWLTGVNRRVASVRPYSIYNTIVRTNARHFFESLLRWVKYVGCSGTVVILDNSRVTLRRNPRDGLLFYSRSAVMDHYELLRELIDSTDRLDGFFMAVLSNNDFLDDDPRGKGYSIYQALMGRIADEVRGRSQPNPMSTLVRLSDTAR